MKEVNLCITEEVDETGLTEMQIKEKGREQLKNRLHDIGILGLDDHEETMNAEINKLVNSMSWSIQAEPELTWAEEVEKDAKNYIKEHLIDSIVKSIIGRENIDNVWHWHLNHSETWYETSGPDLQASEALNLIANLHSFEEDCMELVGSPEEQIGQKAAQTYKNALYSEIESTITDIDASIDIDDLELQTANEILTTQDNLTMEREGVDLSSEDDMKEWAKLEKNEWDETLEKKVKQEVLDCL